MELSQIAQRIKALMDQRGVRRSDLSRDTGIPYHRLNPWFTREGAKPNAEDTERIASYFGVTVAHLVNGDPVAEPDARDWILAVYDSLPPKERDQLEGFARFLEKQQGSQGSEQD